MFPVSVIVLHVHWINGTVSEVSEVLLSARAKLGNDPLIQILLALSLIFPSFRVNKDLKETKAAKGLR